MTREQIMKLFAEYKARGRRASLDGDWVILDGWPFNWRTEPDLVRSIMYR